MLAERLLETFFRSAELTVGLFLDGVEVNDPGYQRQKAGRWNVRGATVSTSVSFGPFTGQRSFNQVVTFEGSDVLDVGPLEGTVGAVPGMVFDAEPTISLIEG